jgi:uncharacterized integral membrane protein
MRTFAWRWAGVAAIVILAGVFSWFNSGESAALHFGLFNVYQIPVVTVFYVSFLLGMVTMFLLGLRHDLQVRRLLRERGFAEEPRPEPRHIDSSPPPDLPM